MPVTYIRTAPFPNCRYCGKRMPYWIPDLDDEKHAHPKCEGKELAGQALKIIRKGLSKKRR